MAAISIGPLRGWEDLPPAANDWTPEEWQAHRNLLDRELRPEGSGFAAHHVLDILRAALPADGILAYDVGAHTHQIATQWRTDLPRTLLATNGWSSMGFGMPAAYAAKMVHPDRAVVGVVGDGCFQMTAGELAVARRRNLAVPIVVLNDGWLGLMKVKQERREFPLSGVELGHRVNPPPHYFGVPCRGATNVEEVEAAIRWGLERDGPSVIEAFIDVEPYSTPSSTDSPPLPLGEGRGEGASWQAGRRQPSPGLRPPFPKREGVWHSPASGNPAELALRSVDIPLLLERPPDVANGLDERVVLHGRHGAGPRQAGAGDLVEVTRAR